MNACVHTYTKPQTSSTRSRGLGWRVHGSVEDTKLSTNKQHSLSFLVLAPNCPHFSVPGHWKNPSERVPGTARLVFRSPQTLRVFVEFMSNISTTRGRQDMRFCVWKPERRSFTNSKSHARLLSVRVFPIGDLKTIHVGGRTDTANRA